jgi:hypothetical protein
MRYFQNLLNQVAYHNDGLKHFSRDRIRNHLKPQGQHPLRNHRLDSSTWILSELILLGIDPPLAQMKSLN